MIRKCVNIVGKEETDFTFRDVACNAGNDLNAIKEGTLASDRIQATSVYWVFFVMMFMSVLTFRLLDARRSQILTEVYSKLTIL